MSLFRSLRWVEPGSALLIVLLGAGCRPCSRVSCPHGGGAPRAEAEIAAGAAFASIARLTAAPERAAVRADSQRIEADVRFLASDELEGRGLGTAGLDAALDFVARRFHDLGLSPVMIERGQRPGPEGIYYQDFTLPGYPPSANLIAILPGNPRRAPSAGRADMGAESPDGLRNGSGVVIVAAHVDHLGRDTTLTGDQIYNGADDNASGVAALLEIARLLHASGGSDRAVVFIVFSGEESGMLGSQYYVAHPVIPNEQVLAMINLDSVGRLRDGRVTAFGLESAREFPALLEGVNQAHGFEIVEGGHGVEGSDHRSFLNAGIPALHFFSGAHEDYSRVSDEADRIAYADLARLSDYVAELVRYLAYRDRPLTFIKREIPPPAAATATAAASGPGTVPARRTSLGFMPDFAAGSTGVRIAQLTPGGAADQAGLRAGDLLVGIDGATIASLEEYTAILRAHAPGDTVRVAIRRGDQELRVPAVLQERR